MRYSRNIKKMDTREINNIKKMVIIEVTSVGKDVTKILRIHDIL